MPDKEPQTLQGAINQAQSDIIAGRQPANATSWDAPLRNAYEATIASNKTT